MKSDFSFCLRIWIASIQAVHFLVLFLTKGAWFGFSSMAQPLANKTKESA